MNQLTKEQKEVMVDRGIEKLERAKQLGEHLRMYSEMELADFNLTINEMKILKEGI